MWMFQLTTQARIVAFVANICNKTTCFNFTAQAGTESAYAIRINDAAVQLPIRFLLFVDLLCCSQA